MAAKLSNNSSWMAQYNYDSSQEFYQSSEINSAFMDTTMSLDGDIATSDDYMQYDMGDTLAEAKTYGRIGQRTTAIIKGVTVAASALLITASAVLEMISNYAPSIAGAFEGGAICQIDSTGSFPTLTYEFEMSYRVRTTMRLAIEYLGGHQDYEYILNPSTSEEGVRKDGSNYLVTISNREEPYALPEGYEGRYALVIQANYGFGYEEIAEEAGRIGE